MVNIKAQQLDQIFSALSDSTRREMLRRLTQGEMSVKALSEPFAISKPAVTKHLKVLENAGLMKRLVVGREHRCRLEAGPLNTATDWLKFYEQFWQDKFDALEQFLSEEKPK
jgi:DNA-binding transcriptional ArsR family regulator